MKKIICHINQLTNRIIPNGPAQRRARHQASLPYSSTVVPSPYLIHPGSPNLVDFRSEDSSINHARPRIDDELTDRGRCLIDMLPDDVLLVMFYIYVEELSVTTDGRAWRTLVHVCPRWRSIVFGSPRRLNLQLVCVCSSKKTFARGTLDIWPALPLVVRCIDSVSKGSADNIVAVLEHRNRVCGIELDASSLHFQNVLAAMQKPFPELTYLRLWSFGGTVPVLPDSFLDGSVSLLGGLYFIGIPFPGLPKLLLSTSHLVNLCLSNIPHSGYFSPEAVVTALSSLNRLDELWLEFQSPRSRPDRRPPPPTRVVLPALTEFRFKGDSEYLEDLVARIDAPRLDKLKITVFNQIVFDMPQFIQFINHTPPLKAPEEANLLFEDGASRVSFSSQTSGLEYFEVKIPCKDLDWQVSSLEQVFTSCLPHLSTLEGLSVDAPRGWLPDWQDNIENTLWLELFLPFTGVKNLYLCEGFARCIVPALQELVEGRRIEVLPALENIFLEEGLEPSEPVEKGIGQFVAMRQVTSHPNSDPIAVTSGQRFSLRRSFSLKQRK